MKRLLTAGLFTALLVLGSGTVASASCYGDLNGDGVVDAADDEVFKSVFGAEDGDADYLVEADLDGDGVIGGTDYAALQRAKADGC